MVCKYFLPSRWSLHFVNGFLCCAEASWFDADPTYFCLFCVGILCQIQKFITKNNIKKLTTYVFFWEFYSFRSWIQIFSPFWVNFLCVAKVGVWFYSSACGCPVSQHHLLTRLSFPQHLCNWLFPWPGTFFPSEERSGPHFLHVSNQIVPYRRSSLLIPKDSLLSSQQIMHLCSLVYCLSQDRKEDSPPCWPSSMETERWAWSRALP